MQHNETPHDTRDTERILRDIIEEEVRYLPAKALQGIVDTLHRARMKRDRKDRIHQRHLYQQRERVEKRQRDQARRAAKRGEARGLRWVQS